MTGLKLIKITAMKNQMKYIISLLLVGIIVTTSSFAGNKTRIGQAGADELLINPWASSSGWGGANSANVKGVEALYLNVAGSAMLNQTELGYANTNWLVGTDISINSMGIVQKVGDSGAR